MNKVSAGLRNHTKKSGASILVRLKGWLKVVAGFLGKVFEVILNGLKNLKRSFLKSFARWVDPKLEAYREFDKKLVVQGKMQPTEKVVVEESVYTPVAAEPPETREELFALLREAPMSVLSSHERKSMSAVLDLSTVLVSEIMSPANKIIFVKQDEKMGPLVLDRLYKSGFTYFPVVDGREHIIGTLHTALLNSLDVKDTKPAKEVMEPRVYYIRQDYTLEQALKAFLRTNTQLMLVVDHYEKIVGMLTFSQIMGFLFDEKFQDEFMRDDDRLAVAKRRV